MANTVSGTFTEIWSDKVIRNADNASVIKPRVNTRYEGEIKKEGDLVHVFQFPDVFTQATTSAVTYPEVYTRSSDLTARSFSMTAATLNVNQVKGLLTDIDDVDSVQSNLNLLDGFTKRFGYAFARDTENYLWSFAGDTRIPAAYSLGTTSGAAYGALTAPYTLSSATIYGWLVDRYQDLNSRNAAPGERCVVVPPWFVGMLKQAAVLSSGTTPVQSMYQGGTKADEDTTRRGIAGNVGGFDIVESNVFFQSGTWGWYWAASKNETATQIMTTFTAAATYYQTNAAHIFGGNLMEGIAFAQQIQKMRTADAPAGFRTHIKQLSVYGGLLLDTSSIFDALVSHA